MVKGSIARVLILGFIFILLWPPRGVPGDHLDLKIEPEKFGIDMFFSGRVVKLSGAIPGDRDVAIEIIGPNENGKFNMKGRVGPLWMNVRQVTLAEVPSFYFLLLPEGSRLESRLDSLGLGIESLKRRMVVRPSDLNHDEIFDLFLKLKKSDGLYGRLKGSIRYTSQGAGNKAFEATFPFPPSTAPGRYRVVASVTGNGRIESRSSRDLEVEEVGIIGRIRDLALNNELLYGSLSVIIALLFGSVIGIIFKRVETH
ncbi:MAG: TIGR02186 family protein [Deltaproteobacteria bacterium]|nr:TIGR02186 family protein [Deltaproteobacteria bacterium]